MWSLDKRHQRLTGFAEIIIVQHHAVFIYKYFKLLIILNIYFLNFYIKQDKI